MQSAYVSRVSNADIYQHSGRFPARYLLLRRQLLFYGHIVRLPMDDVLRCSLLVRNSSKPAHYNIRLLGRPRHEWTDKVFEDVVKIGVDPLVISKEVWKCEVTTYFAALAEARRFFR